MDSFEIVSTIVLFSYRSYHDLAKCDSTEDLSVQI